MAVGDIKSDIQTITAGSRLIIQPPSGESWYLLAVLREANITVEFFDGTLNIPFKVLTGADAYTGTFPITNTEYIRVVNNDVASKNIGYMAVQVR